MFGVLTDTESSVKERKGNSMSRKRTHGPATVALGCTTLVCALVGLVSANGIAAEASRLPSIEGEHVRLHAPSDIELLRARVELSSDGLRIHRLNEGAALEILQSFEDAKVWFVAHDRGIVHELSSSPIDESDEPPPEAATGFLSTDACGGGRLREEGSGLWRGRRVDAVACLDERDRVHAIELVDANHRIVIFRRTPDGLVDELRDIRPRRYPADHFTPRSRFRVVGVRELIHGTPQLQTFAEPETRSPDVRSENVSASR